MLHRACTAARSIPTVCGPAVLYSDMPTPRTHLPFNQAFTANDVRARGLTATVLQGWLSRGQVVRIGRGTYAPAELSDLAIARRIHINRNITEGLHPATLEAAALLHSICVPSTLPPRHKVPMRARDFPSDDFVRLGRLLVPSRALTTFELARWQSLAQALIPIECMMRNYGAQATRQALLPLIKQTAGWPGTLRVGQALELATPLSGSALESCSRGLMLMAGLPEPELQVEFRVGGRVYYVDYLWRKQMVIGESDGEFKFDAAGKAQYAQHRRQADLQSLGFTVVRWGWPELLPSPKAWLQGLQRILS